MENNNIENNIKFIMRTCGDVNLQDYKNNIPNLIICNDTTQNAMDTFRKSLELTGDYACVNMEDDIILCDDFYNKILKEINQRPNDVIQFFSMRKDDITIGSRYINGSRFMMNQCFYMPKELSRKLRDYMDSWNKYQEHPTGYDILMADFFKDNKIKYWNVCPNLVDHKQQKSRINKRRSTKRQSLTFN